MEESRIACPACRCESSSYIAEKNDIPLRQCQSCRSLYCGKVGRHDYDNYYAPDEEHVWKVRVSDFTRARQREVLAGFEPVRQHNRLLDIGFGKGSFLESARALGWTAEGVEIGKHSVEYARANGFTVYQGSIETLNLEAGAYDVVAAGEVIEHVPDPRILLKEVARLVRPGGIAWITTPHWRGISGRLLREKWSVVTPPEHLQLFSVLGMRRLLSECGFEDARIEARGFNPWDFWATLRFDRTGQQPTRGRGQTGSALNEALSKTPPRKVIKRLANAALRRMTLGDSLKVHAWR